ncbi:capsular polysaccharide biosynthesis protein [Clostridium gelidum]|uniref:Capsular polysaccharide biosynthesis protein n=1 Tax=Clostridium gelidum TaxID=704125 RepID=A0ABM7T7R2_9CLOT|nr:hypothetical protein [Clostridium gelidum]BCZ47066.1 capsular polysaccharide biosynthesis protein [Clostridium gelidum]
MRVKEKIKSNDKLYSSIYIIRNRIPKKVMYSHKYFEVIDLLKRQDNHIEIEDILNDKLSNILKNAIKNVPYYRSLNLNIKSNDINKDNVKEILNMFPYLNKKTIMDNNEAFISDLYNRKGLIYKTNGGSTGQFLGTWSSKEENQIEKAFFDYKWSKTGYKSYSKIVRMSCEGIKKEFENPCSYVGDKMRISLNHLNVKWIEEIYNRIKEFKPEFFHAYPISFQYLLQYMELNNLRIDGVKGIFLASEIVTEYVLSLCTSLFNEVPIIFHYGLTERSNLAWGIFENNKISYKCENVYSYSENSITEDGICEIVGTSYWNDAMPLIRYKTQDIGIIEKGIITNLDGRNQELLITKQGQKVHGLTIIKDDFCWKYVEHFQVIQNEPGKIEFHIKPKSSFNSDIEEKMLNLLKAKGGEKFDIVIICKDEIPKTKSGKTRLIINNIR